LRLWEFARAAYGRPGVKSACLELQDVHGQSVCLLLWRLWTLAERRPVEPQGVLAAAAIARDWEGGVIAPLRAVRRRLEDPPGGASVAGVRRLRALAQRGELSAERLLLRALEAMTPAPGADAREIVAALHDLARAWGAGAPWGLLEQLAAG